MTELRDKVATIIDRAIWDEGHGDSGYDAAIKIDALYRKHYAEALKLKAEHDTMMLGHSTLGSKS